MRKHPEILADVSVNHSRTGAVKLLITCRRASSSKLLRGTVRRTTACPRRPQLAAIQPPAPKRIRLEPCGPRVLCSRLSPWHAMGSRCGEPWTPGPSRRVAPPQGHCSSIAAMYPVLATALLRRLPIRPVAPLDRPQRRRRRWPIQRSELLPSRDACGR